MNGLLLHKVSKRFGGVLATDNVSMSVPLGTITGMIGPNGAGKSTIVNLVTGMLSLTAGDISFKGASIGSAQAHEISRAGIARTFQNIRLLPEASVVDNVMIGFHRHETAPLVSCLLGLPASRRESGVYEEKARALITRFGMTRFADFPAGGLAYGHQRRVEMMRALASQPSLILLDEPVAGMNDVESASLGEIFSEISGEGIGILLIEHNMRFVSSLCRHVYVLDGGKLIAQGTPAEVTSNPAVVAAYLGA